MSIIGNLPNNLTNGTTADASQVMADFNFIVNQVNANANPLGVLTAPSGTRAVFQQASAPTGWTVDANSSFTDCAMRFNQTVGTGGSTAWSGWNSSATINCNAVTLAVANLPPHAHPVNDPSHTHGVSDPGHSHSYPYDRSTGTADVPYIPSQGVAPSFLRNTNAAGTGISIAASLTGISVGNTGSGASFTPTFVTPSVKYADCIVGVKS